MAISSPISLGRTSQSASSLKFLSKETGKKTLGISKLLSRGIERKNNLWSSTKLFRNRRIGIEKRVALRDQFRLPLLIGRPTGPRTAALTDTSSSVADRLLGFIGYFSAGWILRNLPTWISIGEQFSSRIVSVGSILSNYGDETLRAMNGIKDVFQSALQNILVFDFTDSSFLVRSSLNDLKLELDALGQGLEDAFNVLFQPFKDVPGIGTLQPDDPTQTPKPQPSPGGGGGGPSGSSYGVNLKALADATSSAEGTYSSVGPFTYYPMGHGLGRYQFMVGRGDVQAIILNNAGNDRAKVARLIESAKGGNKKAAQELLTKYFKPEDQDALFAQHATNTLTQIKRKYPTAGEEFLVQKFGVYHLTGGDYPNESDGYVTGKQHGDKILAAYKRVKGKSQSVISSPANSLSNLGSTTAAITSLFTGQKPAAIPAGQRRLQKGDIFTKSLGKGVDFIQITSLVGDWRKHGSHGGIDVAAPSGTYIALRADCEVVRQGDTGGGYGIKMDIWVPEYGIQLRMAHLSGVIIKSGKIPAGKSFARVGSTGSSRGPHIHLEYDTKKGETRYGGARNDDPNYAAKLDQYVRLLFLTKDNNKGQFSPAPMTPLVPGTPSITMESEDGVGIDSNNYYSNFLNDIQQERKGRKIIIIDDRGSTISQQVITSDGGGRDIQIQIPESALLNNFIKNKLLLDLNYL